MSMRRNVRATKCPFTMHSHLRYNPLALHLYLALLQFETGVDLLSREDEVGDALLAGEQQRVGEIVVGAGGEEELTEEVQRFRESRRVQ